jgi:hypothetical protein
LKAWINLKSLKTSRSLKDHVLGVLMLLFLSTCARGPENAASFKTIFDHYRSEEQITAISLPPGLVSLVLPSGDPELAELKELISGLSSFRMLSVPGNSPGNDLAVELRLNVTEFTYREGFSDLFRLQSGEDDIFIRILEKEESVREAIIMIGSPDELNIVNLRGNISMELFSKLAEGGHLSGLGNLADIYL